MKDVSIASGNDVRMHHRIGRVSHALSSQIAWVERKLVIGFIAGIFALILLNVGTRAIGRPLIWVDEAAIYLMVMTCFVGTSLSIRQRLDFAMTLVLDHLDKKMRSNFNRVLAIVGVAYAFFILWCCWRMFDPVGLWRSGFDMQSYGSASMNFIYSEPTQTLGIPKWWIYLVMPLYGIGISIHSIANLWEDFGWVEISPIAKNEAILVEAG